MRQQGYADTGYWIARQNARDELHAEAVDVSQRLSAARIVTSEMVLVELLNSFSDGGPRLRKAITSAVEALRGNRNVMVSPQTPEQFETALERYKQTEDKCWSLTDYASFQIMKVEHIQASLTHDRIF